VTPQTTSSEVLHGVGGLGTFLRSRQCDRVCLRCWPTMRRQMLLPRHPQTLTPNTLELLPTEAPSAKNSALALTTKSPRPVKSGRKRRHPFHQSTCAPALFRLLAPGFEPPLHVFDVHSHSLPLPPSLFRAWLLELCSQNGLLSIYPAGHACGIYGTVF